MNGELELLRGIAGEHGRCLDIMADMRRAKMSGDRMRHGQLIRDLRISMEQRDALHQIWRRSYAGHAATPNTVAAVEIEEPAETLKTQTIDLMEALKASLARRSAGPAA